LTETEIISAIAALVVLLLFLLGVRRAARRQIGDRRPSGELAEARGAEAARPPAPAPSEEPAEHVAPGQTEDQARQAASEAEVERLRAGLAKTRGGFVARLGRLFAGKQIDAHLLEELEEVLLTADIGPRTADRLFRALKDKLSKAELNDADAIWRELRATSAEILAVDGSGVDFDREPPFVLLTVGVNGVGKTTTIGKLAALQRRRGKRVLLGAGDTFRAAATEQLEVWGQRADAPVVRGKSEADPSSVIFETIQRGVREQFDIVIADTAGRLHTKVELMDELKKVRRVCGKALPGAPHETWLVVDATTGQNAIAQAQMFKEALEITGIVLTKLDGTAKGGVILGICDELKVPVRYIGVGEQIDDLRPFDPAAFIDALFGDRSSAGEHSPESEDAA
jgi:fused signal recognition particle receptor